LAIFQRRSHYAKRAAAIFGWLRNVIRVAGHTVAHNFRQDFGTAFLSMLERFQNQDAAPSPTTNPSRCASNGRLACEGSSLRVDSAFIEANPPMPSA